MSAGFPRQFWTANLVELLERAAYYAVASFMVIYFHENLGMSATTATFLNGSLLWGLIYFLPVLSGSLADSFGFKRALTLAFVLLFGGYLILGRIEELRTFFGFNAYLGLVVAAILFIGIGGSIVKPCIAGTVQKVAGSNATLAFSIFYMVINIGSISGRAISYFVRIRLGLPAIFSYVAAFFVLMALLVVLLLYRKDDSPAGSRPPLEKVAASLKGIVTVLGNLRFVFFLVVIGFFWILYVQIYNLIPLFLRYISPEAPVELYTLTNPVMIVALQLLVTKFAKKLRAVRSIMLGVAVSTVGILLNLVPQLFGLDISALHGIFGLMVPLGGIFVIVSIAGMALGEMMASPRIYEYIGAIAPKGQEGLYLGYANLPLAFGSIAGAPLGGYLFQRFIVSPELAGKAPQIATLWIIVGLMGLVSMIGLFVYDRYFMKNSAPENQA